MYHIGTLDITINIYTSIKVAKRFVLFLCVSSSTNNNSSTYIIIIIINNSYLKILYVIII